VVIEMGPAHSLVPELPQSLLTYKLKQVAGFNPLIINGFVPAATHPVVNAVGAGEEHGSAKTCHVEAIPVAVQLKETELDNTDVDVKAIGLGHTTGGPQVMLDDQPAAVVVALEVNTKVKLPSGALEVITGGKVVPEKEPIKLAGETVPLYIFKTSLFNSVLKVVNVTVTTSPTFVGFTTVVPVAAVVLFA